MLGLPDKHLAQKIYARSRVSSISVQAWSSPLCPNSEGALLKEVPRVGPCRIRLVDNTYSMQHEDDGLPV